MRQKPPKQPIEPGSQGPDHGSFRPDGSWNPNSDRSDTYFFVLRLCRATAAGAPPSAIAREVANSHYPNILGDSNFASCPDDLWWQAWPHTSAAATIRRYVPRETSRPVQPNFLGNS